MEKCAKLAVDGSGKVTGVINEISCNPTVIQNGISIPALYWTSGILIILAILIFTSYRRVKEQTVVVVERFGKFHKIMTSGLNFKLPLVDKIAGVIDLKTQQLVVEVETKTKDNVFVTVPVAVQYFVVPTKAFDSFYKLSNPQAQIKSYVFDTVRGSVPTMILDDVFENKQKIALAVKEELSKTMDDYGYAIVTALVTDIDPAPRVKEAMNEINAQQRFRQASIEKGEGEKTLIVKRAEAESESKRLQGEGIAKERFAIVSGLRESVALMEKETGINGEEVMKILMLTQYFDTMKSMGDKGNSTVFLPSSPDGVNSLQNQIITAIKSSNIKKNE